jgi:RNA polymerase sigma-70 factor (ECF subfamily)
VRVEPIECAGAATDFESVFRRHYGRIARVIAMVIRDRSRAEELAMDAFWRYWRTPAAQGEKAGGWLYRTAVRLALNELRRRTRSARYEGLSAEADSAPTPEELRASSEAQEHVRETLAQLGPRQAEMLTLRANGLSYEEVAAALEINPASVGTLLARAQRAFRELYVAQFGEQDDER